MATKKTSFSDKAKDAQGMILRAFSQAKDSLRLLESLEKEAVNKAKNYVKIPTAEAAVEQANEILVASLSRAGLATTAQVTLLEERIAALETSLKEVIKTLSDNAVAAAKKTPKATPSQASAPATEAQN